MPVGSLWDFVKFSRILHDVIDRSLMFLKLVINLYVVLTDAYRIPIESYRFGQDFDWTFFYISQIFLKLVIDLYIVLIDAYRIPIESNRCLKISMGFY